MMYKATIVAALSLLILEQAEDASALMKKSTVSKHEFIKKMRAAHKEKNLAQPGRRMNWSKLTDKSVHKPGVRSTVNKGQAVSTESRSAVNTKSKSQHPVADSIPQKPLSQDGKVNRDLGFMSWWSNTWGNRQEEFEDLDADLEEAMENATDDQLNSWLNWNYNSNDDTDDKWTIEDNNETAAVIEGLKSFSIKYDKCVSLTSYGTMEDGDDEKSPITSSQLVSYRLCPTDSCNDNSWSGCQSEYGEYVMPMEDFLKAQQDYVDEEFEAYCVYCYNCIYFDQWYTGEDDSVHGCDLYEECEDYEQSCSEEGRDEAEEELGYNYEEFLECVEVDADLYYGGGGNVGYDESGEYYSNLPDKVYIGPHCIAGSISVGLFSDEECTSYIGNEETMIDTFNTTEYGLEASVINEVYVPQGCHSCEGDNIKRSQYFAPEQDNEQEIEEYYEEDEDEDYEVCYNMYTRSAKCQYFNNCTDDADCPLALSDDEMTTNEATCDFIEQVQKNHVSSEGFVYSRQGNVGVLDRFFGESQEVTAAQAVILGITIVGAMSLTAVVLHLRQEVETMNVSLLPAKGNVV